jgi:hypothetical protein
MPVFALLERTVEKEDDDLSFGMNLFHTRCGRTRLMFTLADFSEGKSQEFEYSKDALFSLNPTVQLDQLTFRWIDLVPSAVLDIYAVTSFMALSNSSNTDSSGGCVIRLAMMILRRKKQNPVR